MRHFNYQQRSPEWLACRLGVPSASNFDKVMTPAKLKPSSSQPAYLARLVCEWFLGVSMDEETQRSQFMDRGTAMEDEAVAWLEFQHGVTTEPCGYCMRDDMDIGCTPDRFLGESGLLEIKCPGAETHMAYLLHGGLDDDYRMQTQGQLWVTGREYVLLVSYHPILPKVEVEVRPDPAWVAAFDPIARAFCWSLEAAKARLAEDKAAYDESMMAGMAMEESPI